MTCPGCDGPISRGAKLCRRCRSTAITVGVDTMLHPAQALAAAHAVPATPRTPEQNRVYHGKCASLAQVERVDLLEAKRRALLLASRVAGREIASSTELTEMEMERVLEALDRRLADLGYIRRAPAHA